MKEFWLTGLCQHSCKKNENGIITHVKLFLIQLCKSADKDPHPHFFLLLATCISLKDCLQSLPWFDVAMRLYSIINNVAGKVTWYLKPKLPACHLNFLWYPKVITYSFPTRIDTDVNPSLKWSGVSCQSYLSMCALLSWNSWTHIAKMNSNLDFTL